MQETKCFCIAWVRPDLQARHNLDLEHFFPLIQLLDASKIASLTCHFNPSPKFFNFPQIGTLSYFSSFSILSTYTNPTYFYYLLKFEWTKWQDPWTFQFSLYWEISTLLYNYN